MNGNFHTPLEVFQHLTGIRVANEAFEAAELMGDLFTMYKIVKMYGQGAPASQALEMLLDLQTFHAVVGVFCADNNCLGDTDLMETAFRTVDGMSEEDIELAMAIYTIADRLFDDVFEDLFDEVIEAIDNKTNGGASAVTDKLSDVINEMIVDVIVEQTGLPEEIVELVIAQADGDFKKFYDLLKTARKAAKAGKSVTNMTSILSGNGDSSDKATKVIGEIVGLAGGDGSEITDGLSKLCGFWGC